VHDQYCFHRFDAIDKFTLGWTPAPLLDRAFQLRTCPRCTNSFKDGSFECQTARSFKVSLCTLLAGTCAVFVTPVRCNICSSIVGEEPWDYHCVPGNNGLWFDEAIIDVLGESRDASGNKFSHQAAAATLRSLHERRSSVRQNRRIDDGLKNAQKCVNLHFIVINYICSPFYFMFVQDIRWNQIQ